MSEQKSALIRLFGVAIIWGINYVLSAYLLHAFSPILLSFLRIIIGFAILMLFLFKASGVQRPTKAEWLLLLCSSVFFILIQQPLYFLGLQYSTPANASLIYAVAPVVTLFLEAVFLKAKVSSVKMIGALLGFVGVLVIVGFNGKAFGVSLGDLYLLIAMLGMSISLLFTPRLYRRMSAYSISIFSSIVGMVLLLPMVYGEKRLNLLEVSGDWLIWALLIAMSVLTALAGLWWIRGVAIVGPGRASLFNNIPPFVALLMGFLILGDAINWTQILGGILVLAGVFISNRKWLQA